MVKGATQHASSNIFEALEDPRLPNDRRGVHYPGPLALIRHWFDTNVHSGWTSSSPSSAWLRREALASTSLLRVVGPSTTRTSKIPGLNPVPASPYNWERWLERV